jgi:hypothetical protein
LVVVVVLVVACSRKEACPLVSDSTAQWEPGKKRKEACEFVLIANFFSTMKMREGQAEQGRAPWEGV